MLNGIALYLILINVLAIMLTMHDKRTARQRKRRVRESTLLLTAALGSSVGKW